MGRRFSGSTILGRILDASREVRCVGETGPVSMGFASCKTCGGKCKVMEYDKYKGVGDSVLYRKLRKQSGWKTLVTTDKRYNRVGDVTKNIQFASVFVFKTPFAMCASEKRGHPRHVGPGGKPAIKNIPLEEALDSYAEYYRRSIIWKNPRRKIFVNLESLCNDFENGAKKLFDVIGIEHPGGVIDISKIDHHFAIGNFDAMDSKSIQVDRRWVDELTRKEKDLVGKHKGAQNVYLEMMKLSVV